MTIQSLEHRGQEQVSIDVNLSNKPHPVPTTPGQSMESLEVLGRRRPAVFRSAAHEIGFVFSIAMSQFMTEYFLSGFTVVLPALTTAQSTPTASSIWLANSFSLSIAALLLVFGRLADMRGGWAVYVAGCAWLAAWTLAAGFSTSAVAMAVCRAMQGVGAAAYLPASLMLLGSAYRPGRRKNRVFAVFGAAPPLGLCGGTLVAGLAEQYLSWQWYFWVGAVVSAVTAGTAYLTIPSDWGERRDMNVRMDVWGAVTSVCGLVLVVYALNDSCAAPDGWRTPYIPIAFGVGVLLLCVTAYIESRPDTIDALLPPSFFRVPGMAALTAALFLTYGSLGVFTLYATLYMRNVMAASPLQLAAWYVPMAGGGCLIAVCGGFVLHRVPGRVLVVIGGLSWIAAPVVFATAATEPGFWPTVFPAMICATLGIDVTYSVCNVFISTALPRSQQGLAGAVSMLMLHLGIAVCLSVANIVATAVAPDAISVEDPETHQIDSTRKAYAAVFWFEVGCAAVALLIMMGFVHLGRAESDLTADEKMQQPSAKDNVVESVEAEVMSNIEG